MVHHKGELQFPDNYTDTAIKKFLKDYFESSNTPNAHEETGSYFTENGVFCIEILALRERMWDSVPGREHRAHRIFPFQTNKETKNEEFMVYGTVTYKHHDGAHKDTGWGGRMELAKDHKSGQQKIAILHCFLVSALVKL
ncbi:hypothetical protein OEA41_009973 [Lepraria neglecta]|uniref:Uncharacterized protein n=1 Tax=Lepraria neglecta TaxID=209136 RepID=A0AAD9YY55_9LECA|nr:hypothetical protein OEA41_009973 [Lepraria neglecta]